VTQEVFYLSYEDALAAHRDAVGLETPFSREMVRDPVVLEAILLRPRRLAIHGNADIVAQSAALMQGVAVEQPWYSGNLRAAIQITFTFMLLNGFEVFATEEEVLDLAAALEDSASEFGIDQADAWLRSHICR